LITAYKFDIVFRYLSQKCNFFQNEEKLASFSALELFFLRVWSDNSTLTLEEAFQITAVAIDRLHSKGVFKG
jgi:hypothetical protein